MSQLGNMLRYNSWHSWHYRLIPLVPLMPHFPRESTCYIFNQQCKALIIHALDVNQNIALPVETVISGPSSAVLSFE